MLYFQITERTSADAFQQMTYRPFQEFLASTSLTGSLVAFAAQSDRPAGLVLARVQPDNESAEVLSLYVALPYRSQGVGTALMAHLETELVQRAVRQAWLVYPTGKQSTPALERLLARRRWGTPLPRMHLYQVGHKSVAPLLDSAWMQPRRLPAGYDIVPWIEISEAERMRLQQWERDGEFPAMLTPFQNEDCIDNVSSLGLRYRNVVVGWMINHRLAPHTLRFCTLLVDPELSWKGAGWRLFAESLRRFLLAEGHEPDVAACFGIHENNPFATFVQERLLPHLPDAVVRTTMECTKQLNT